MTPISPSFLRAVVPPTVRLGGRRLLPLTLGHAVLLRAIGSPFAPYPVAGAELRVPSRGDVALARFILSRSWTEAMETMDSRANRRRMFWWGMLHARDWMIEALLAHIATAAAVPVYEVTARGSDGGDSGPPGACTELRLLTHLVALGRDPERALNTPVALAWWLRLADTEARGGLRLLPEPDPDAAPLPPTKTYPPEVLAAWGAAQQQRQRAGQPYDAAVHSLDVVAARLAPAPGPGGDR